jgi:hypothetical protein
LSSHGSPLVMTLLLYANPKHIFKMQNKLKVINLLCYTQVHYELPKMKVMQEASWVLLGFCCTFNFNFFKSNLKPYTTLFLVKFQIHVRMKIHIEHGSVMKSKK